MKLKTFRKGYTLIEVIIALGIAVILIILIANLLVQGYRQYFLGFGSLQAQNELVLIMNNIADDLREATLLFDAQSQSITFRKYEKYTDSAPSQIRYFLDGTNLKRGVIAPTGSGPDYTYDPDNEVVKFKSSLIANGVQGIFSYYDKDGQLLSAPFILGNVTLIKLRFVFDQGKGKNPLNTETQVQLRFNKTNL